ncbi:MAG: 50S ribosomal protein L22 [Myxococcota bacterium]
MISRAKLKFLRIAPRKVRIVADLVRGKQVEEALNILAFTPKRAAEPLAKLIKSAVANAEQIPDARIDTDRLFISKLMVDGGPVLKRYLPRAHGRATKILKRTSHITIQLDAKE